MTALLPALDAVLAQGRSSGHDLTKADFHRLLKPTAPNNELLPLAVTLGLLVQKRRHQLSAEMPSDANERQYIEFLRRTAPAATATSLWPIIVARTDELYSSIEDLESVFK